jgi:C-5 cytosine-specific DNA methylase
VGISAINTNDNGCRIALIEMLPVSGPMSPWQASQAHHARSSASSSCQQQQQHCACKRSRSASTDATRVPARAANTHQNLKRPSERARLLPRWLPQRCKLRSHRTSDPSGAATPAHALRTGRAVLRNVGNIGPAAGAGCSGHGRNVSAAALHAPDDGPTLSSASSCAERQLYAAAHNAQQGQAAQRLASFVQSVDMSAKLSAPAAALLPAAIPGADCTPHSSPVRVASVAAPASPSLGSAVDLSAGVRGSANVRRSPRASRTPALQPGDNARRLRAVVLFCGMGGTTQGVIDAGYDVVCAVDICERALQVYRKNFGAKGVLCRDLRIESIVAAIIAVIGPWCGRGLG